VSALPARLSTRVGQLLRLALDSDQVGEIAGAIGAIKRTLATVGIDHHDFAELIECGLDRPARSARQPDLDPLDDWRSSALYCMHHADQLSDKEWGFIETIIHYKRQPTERQREWLEAIYARIAR